MMVTEQQSILDSLDDDFTLAWKRYIDLHPEVYSDIVRRVLHKSRFENAHRISMKGIFEDLREHGILRDRDAAVALNNNWTSVCGRQLVAEYPELEELIKTRKRLK